MQIETLMSEPMTFVGADAMQAMQIALESVESHIAAAGGDSYHQPKSACEPLGSIPSSGPRRTEVVAQSLWLKDPDGQSVPVKLYIDIQFGATSDEADAREYTCCMELLPMFPGLEPFKANDQLSALQQGVNAALLLLDTYCKNGWEVLTPPPQKLPITFAQLINSSESDHSTKLVEDLATTHPRLAEFIKNGP